MIEHQINSQGYFTDPLYGEATNVANSWANGTEWNSPSNYPTLLLAANLGAYTLAAATYQFSKGSDNDSPVMAGLKTLGRWVATPLTTASALGLTYFTWPVAREIDRHSPDLQSFFLPWAMRYVKKAHSIAAESGSWNIHPAHLFHTKIKPVLMPDGPLDKYNSHVEDVQGVVRSLVQGFSKVSYSLGSLLRPSSNSGIPQPGHNPYIIVQGEQFAEQMDRNEQLINQGMHCLNNKQACAQDIWKYMQDIPAADTVKAAFNSLGGHVSWLAAEAWKKAPGIAANACDAAGQYLHEAATTHPGTTKGIAAAALVTGSAMIFSDSAPKTRVIGMGLIAATAAAAYLESTTADTHNNANDTSISLWNPLTASKCYSNDEDCSANKALSSP